MKLHHLLPTLKLLKIYSNNSKFLLV